MGSARRASLPTGHPRSDALRLLQGQPAPWRFGLVLLERGRGAFDSDAYLVAGMGSCWYNVGLLEGRFFRSTPTGEPPFFHGAWLPGCLSTRLGLALWGLSLALSVCFFFRISAHVLQSQHLGWFCRASVPPSHSDISITPCSWAEGQNVLHLP